MPKTSWFKNLLNWKRSRTKETESKKKKLPRTKRMRSFKIKDISGLKINAYDSQGRDISHSVKYSHVYNGIPGGFYLDIKHP
tara:strand:- start:74 stop:319 length:246 start_codon:yes stop_codon:yes gene_type:complete